MNNKFNIGQRIKSFKHALNGLWLLILYEHNARIHVVAAGCVIALGIGLNINATEWAILSLAIGSVLATEAVNSAVEALADMISPEIHPIIKKAKDLAASAVLIASVAAIAVGAAIFAPKFFI